MLFTSIHSGSYSKGIVKFPRVELGNVEQDLICLRVLSVNDNTMDFQVAVGLMDTAAAVSEMKNRRAALRYVESTSCCCIQ